MQRLGEGQTSFIQGSSDDGTGQAGFPGGLDIAQPRDASTHDHPGAEGLQGQRSRQVGTAQHAVARDVSVDQGLDALAHDPARQLIGSVR